MRALKMTKEQHPGESKDEETKENARVGYQASIDLASLYGSVTEDRVSSLLVANSVLIGTVVLLLSSQKPIMEFLFLLPAMGIVMNALWAISVGRSYNQFKYYIWSASELEEHYLSNAVKAVSRGGNFADGEQVSIRRKGVDQTLQMPWCCRKVKAEWITYSIVLAFGILYAMLVIFSVHLSFPVGCQG